MGVLFGLLVCDELTSSKRDELTWDCGSIKKDLSRRISFQSLSRIGTRHS